MSSTLDLDRSHDFALSPDLAISVAVESRPFISPFAISDRVMTAADIIVVSITSNGVTGRGEANGVYYLNETPAVMIEQIERLVANAPAAMDRLLLQQLMPPGGARNAMDCAFWDLEAKLAGRPVWQLAGLPTPKPLRTTMTLPVDTPVKMAEAVVKLRQFNSIKIKLAGDGRDDERIKAVRRARPDVWMGVDANQGLNTDKLQALFAVCLDANVSLIEQPFKRGEDLLLDDIRSPIFIAADESVQGIAEVDSLVGRYDVVNIKLDKCGGLTEALAIVQRARELRLRVMVGCMMGTSLCLAPMWMLAQVCDYIDLDTVAFLKEDRADAAIYKDGLVSCPDQLWGNP
jgi:L-Ala-D/L-Glu epimerase